MTKYSLKYEDYRFDLDTKRKIIEVYLNGFREPAVTFAELPAGIKWKNLGLIINDEDKGLERELTSRLFKIYKKL